MKKNQITTFIMQTLLVIASVFMLSSTAMAKDNEINWNEYNKTIFTKSAKTKRPILLVVKADWCPHCTKMRETTLVDTSVVKMVNESFVPVMIDADNDKALVKKYNVTGLPTFLILNSKGKVLKETSGEVSVINFLQMLSEGHKTYEANKA